MATAPSLFGATPESIQQARVAALNQEANAYAQLDPFQRASAGLYRGGNQLGGAIGRMLGGQDPEMMRMQQRQQIVQGINLNDPNALRQAAQQFSQMGDFQAAQELSARAQTAQLQSAQINKAEEEATRLTTSNQKEDRLSAALSSLPPDATDQQVEAVVRQFGKPEAVLASVVRRQAASAAQEARDSLAAEKAAAKVEAADRADQRAKENIALRAQIAGPSNSLQNLILQERLDALNDKKEQAREKAAASKDVALRHATKVITDVDEALAAVGPLTSGILGSGIAVIKGTPAYDLQQLTSTIKANLGFDRLQQMRDNSPTGGALGQVAVQELEALQRSVASLEIGQSGPRLTENLGKIKKHYEAWKNATEGRTSVPKLGNQPNDKARVFASEAEATAANLPVGTEITINGRRALVE
jgi:hypothetical protein